MPTHTSRWNDTVKAVCQTDRPKCEVQIYNDAWSMYRLGDMVLYRDWQLHSEHGAAWHKAQFPRSLVAAYTDQIRAFNGIGQTGANEATESTLNYPKARHILQKVIDRHIIQRRLHTNHGGVAIHVRVGDILDADEGVSWYDTLCALNGTLQMAAGNVGFIGNTYVRPLWYYHAVGVRLRQQRISNVTMVVGGIRGWKTATSTSKSCAYISAVASVLEESNLYVTIRATDPDSDFIFLSTSSLLITSGGGYSTAAAFMCLHYNGTVWSWDDLQEQMASWNKTTTIHHHSVALCKHIKTTCAISTKGKSKHEEYDER